MEYIEEHMVRLLHFLNENAGALSVLFMLVVAISTLFYAILTWRLTSETTKMRKAQTEPKISIFLQTCRVGMGFFDLIVKNIGLGSAYNVRFKVLEEFNVRGDRKLSDIDFIHEGIKYMPPNYSVQTFFLQLMGDHYKEIIDKNIRVQAIYENSKGEKISEIINLNMSQFKGRQRLGDDPMNVIAKNIEKIQRDIHGLSSGFHHLRIDTCTSKDREKIEIERQKQFEEMKQKQQEPKENKNL